MQQPFGALAAQGVHAAELGRRLHTLPDQVEAQGVAATRSAPGTFPRSRTKTRSIFKLLTGGRGRWASAGCPVPNNRRAERAPTSSRVPARQHSAAPSRKAGM